MEVKMDKWERILFQIEKRAKIIDSKTEEFDVDVLSNGEVIKGTKEVVIFSAPKGKMKVEKITKPRVLGKKIISSKRVGGRVVEDFVYSPEEKVVLFKVYQWDKEKGDWVEMSLEQI